MFETKVGEPALLVPPLAPEAGLPTLNPSAIYPADVDSCLINAPLSPTIFNV